MPSMRLYEGDLKILMSLLENMNDKLISHGSAIAAIVNDIHNLQPRSKPVSSVCQGVINTMANAVIPGHSSTGNPDSAKPCLASDHNKPASVNKPSKTWADRVAAASTPCRNRFDALTTTTDDDLSDNPYIEQQSRNYRRSGKLKLDDCVSQLNPSHKC